MKGQVESVGLVIIVVLVIVIFLFALVFMTKEEVKSSSSLSVKADNLMNALTKVNINGKGIEESVSECCEGSCTSFSKEIEKILKRSLEEEYSFRISKNNQICEEIGNCEIGIASSMYRLRSEGDQFELQAVLC